MSGHLLENKRNLHYSKKTHNTVNQLYLNFFKRKETLGLSEPCFFHSVKKICNVLIFERRGEKFIKLNLFLTVISHMSLHYLHLILSAWTSANRRCASVTRSFSSFLYHLKISLYNYLSLLLTLRASLTQ